MLLRRQEGIVNSMCSIDAVPRPGGRDLHDAADDPDEPGQDVGSLLLTLVPRPGDVLYCTVLYCTVLYCTVLYCTVLYRSQYVAVCLAPG